MSIPNFGESAHLYRAIGQRARKRRRPIFHPGSTVRPPPARAARGSFSVLRRYSSIIRVVWPAHLSDSHSKRKVQQVTDIRETHKWTTEYVCSVRFRITILVLRVSFCISAPKYLFQPK